MLEIVETLQKSTLFTDWKTQHPNAFLSHLFCQISNTLDTKGEWEIGYYDSSKV